jgi:CheY-like chemotaxis protein
MDEQTTPNPQQTPQDINQPLDQVSEPISQPASEPEQVSDQAPASESQPEPTQTPVEQPASSSGMKKVLLVEDDNNLADVYSTRLEAEGFDIQRVPNGEDALASALQYKPDLILLDVMMPKVSGFDVLDILRNTPETSKVKIVMLTALGQDSDQQRAKDLGVDDYLVKSQVVIADVVDRIKFHLNM